LSPSVSPDERVQPVLGTLARQAMRVDAGGGKRRKLLTLVAAYADAGEASPSLRTLASGLKVNWQSAEALLKLLERDGFLEVAWRQGRDQRNVYTVRLNGRQQ
jgi:hypothetical protein